MINFEEEIKKFHPSLEIEEAEDAIYNNNISDITDAVSYTHLTLPTKLEV